MESKEKLNEKDLEEEKPEDVLKALLPDKKLCDKLYPHQREGIVFFFKAYKNEKSRAKGSRNGAILADEMGLGKSIQVILFLHAMIMNTQEFKNALLIVPAGLLNDWKDKLKRWTPNMNVFIYHHSDTELARKLRNLQKTGGIVLVSYRMFINNYKTLTTYKGMHFVWDCLICDEAHKLKNPATKTHKAVALTSAGFNILITGTPMQNNLREFWSLFSLISDTYVLGTYKTFKNKFENPITKGLEADSGPEERALGMELQRTLEKITEPFWLRRRKDQIQELRGQPLLENIPSDQVLHLPKKNEYVVWIKLSSEQEAAYRKITDNSSTLTLQSIHSLIAVCTHPKLNSDIMAREASEVHLAESGKLTFMLALLEKFTANGNFALVFSNYIKILDIIEKSLTQTSWGRNAFLRIDGQNSNQRDKIIRTFQKRESKNILLLTTSVGAEGFTLTAADCVVFADLSWNQSQDAQAVGRAHRIGQTKDVKTYRLITCGTLEEMIYRRQLFKGSLTRQVVGDEKNPFRRFTQDELKGILTLQETQFSSTQQQLEKQGAKYLDITEVFRAGISSVGFASVCGISDHGQLLSASQGEDLEVAMARMHIKETAEMSQQEIEAESNFARQQICKDVSVKKCGRKAKVRRWRHETRTPGLPRKYKCYTSPFSGTRRKNLHISRPCVFDSSDSSNLSADDEVNLSENTVPHISVTGKSEVMGDSLNQCSASVFMCNNTCSEDNNGLTELLQESAYYDAESMSQPSSYSSPNGSYINKSCPGGGIHLKSETVRNSDKDAVSLLSEMSDLLGKNTRYCSLSTDKTKQTAHVSRSCVSDLSDNPSISADEQFSGTIMQREESDTVSDGDQDDVSLSHNISVLSNAHTLRSEMNMMQEFELEELTVFQEETNVMGVKSAEARKQEIQLKQDDQIMSSRDTVEFSEHVFKNDPNTDLDKDVSTATDLDNAESSVAVSHIPLNTPVYHEYISTPDNSVSASDSMDRTSDFEYCSDSQSHKASISTPTEGSYNFHKDNSIDKNETSLLPDANNISPNPFGSGDSLSLSVDDEVNLSENTIPHISVTGKSEVTGDSVDPCSAATCMCNTTCSEDNDGISELLQESTYCDDRSSSSSNGSHINKSFSGGSIHLNKSNTVINNDEDAVNLSSEMNEEPVKNMHYSSPSHDKTEEAAHVSRSCVSDLNDTSSISVNESFSEDIIHFKQSDTVEHNDQGDVTLSCNISVLSNAHGFRSGNTMQESELAEPTAFHEELIPKGVKSAEVEQQQTQVIQDEIMRSLYTLEFSDHISKSHPDADLDMNVSPVTDVIKNMSFVTDLNLDMSASHLYISTPEKTSDSEYCSGDTHNHRTSISSTRNVRYNYTFPEDNYMGKNETSNLQEASSISTNSATGSNVCMFMSDVSLVQSSESGNKQEASSQEVKFIDPVEQKLPMNGEQEETVQLKRPLSLNTHACNDPPPSPIPVTSSESQEKTTLNQDQELHQAEDRFETSLKSNQIVPKLCDYSLTPSCLALSITPSAGKEKHDSKLKQLNECSELNVLKEQTDVQDVKFIDPRGQKDLKKCEYEQKLCPKMFLDLSKQHLNLAHHSSESSHPLSERETLLNLEDHELADLSSEGSFKSGLKSNLIAPVLCDYSLTPGCVSLLDTLSVGKGKYVFTECFQSTPMQSIQVEHQETQDLWKRRLSFSHSQPGNEGNSSTPLELSSKGKPSESVQLKRSEKRTPGLPQKYKRFSPSLAKTGKRKITDLDKKVERQRTTVTENDSSMAHNAEKHSLSPAGSTYRSTRTKCFQSTVSSTTHEYNTNVMGVKSAEARKQEIRLKQDDQIMSSRDTVEFSEHIFKNDPSTDLDKDVSTATDLDNDESSVAVSHIPLNTPVYHEYISTPDNSVSASDSMNRTSDFEYCSDSQSHKASISTPTEGSYNFHKDNSIDKNETSLLPDANNISPNAGATESSIDISMSSKNQVQPIESDKFADLKEEANFQRIKTIVPREQKFEHEEIVHPKRPQILNSQPSDDPSQSPIPAPSSESQEKTTLNQEDQELQLTSEDLEVDMAEVHITETVKMCQQEIEAESYLAGQQSCIDVSLKKPDRKAKIRRRSHETRSPSHPRKYICYCSPFSGTRRKTLHISRPCVFGSGDSLSLSVDDEVNLSENTIPHISVTGKSEVTGDSVDPCSAATCMCNTTCSEDNDGISELLQESTYCDDRSSSSSNGSYINKSFSGGSIHLNKSNTVINNDEDAVNLSSEMNEEPVKNMHYSSPTHDKTEEAAHVSRSCVSDLNDTSSISVNESFSEDIIHFKQSDTVEHNDQGDVTLSCNISVLSNAHGFRSGNTMQESELAEPTAFHEELIPKGVKSAEAEQQQTQVIQDEIMRSLYTLEFSDHISKSHPDADVDMNVSPVTDVIKNMSFVTDLNLDMSASHLYISTPEKTSDSEYCSGDTHNHRTSISSTRNVRYNCTFPEDNYMGKNETSNLQEASSISTNSATGSNVCMFMSDVSLVQSSESGNKQEASSQEVKFIDPVEQKLLVNGEQEETVQLKRPLSLNTHACNDPPPSPIPVTSSESQEKTTLNQDEELHQAEDRFETSLKSNQIVPKLCDYSLAPGCLALSITPSAGKEKHDSKLKQLNECSELNVLKEQTDVQDVKFIDPRGQKDLKKCEYEQKLCPKMFLDLSKQHLNFAHHSSDSSHPLSERETLWTVKDYEPADLSSEGSFKSGLKSNLIAPVLCDYSLTPDCVSLLDTPSVGQVKHVLSEHLQSTPMQFIEVEHQETQDLLKRRLSFSHSHPGNEGNSSTPLELSSKGKPSESVQLKRSEKRTPGLHQKYKRFSPSLAKTGKRKITDLDKKVERQRTTVTENDSSMAHNAEKHSLSPAGSTYRSTRTKCFQSTVSSTTHEYKYGKENHDRTLPAMCSYSFSPSAISQSSKPQTRKITQTCLSQRQLNICEDTDVKSVQKSPTNTDTNESRLNTLLVNLLANLNTLSCNNASFRKVQRSLFKQKGQLRKKRLSLKCSRPSFSVTYRKRKKKLLESMGNVCLNQVIEQLQGRQLKFDGVTSDLNVSLITDEHIYALDTENPASRSSSASCSKFSKGNSPTENTQNSIQCLENDHYYNHITGMKDIDGSLNDVSEGDSVDSIKTINVDVNADQGHHILKEHLSTSFMQFNQFPQTSTLDNHKTLQDCSKTSNSESGSHKEDDKDHDYEIEDCKNEIFRLMGDLKRL